MIVSCYQSDKLQKKNYKIYQNDKLIEVIVTGNTVSQLTELAAHSVETHMMPAHLLMLWRRERNSLSDVADL